MQATRQRNGCSALLGSFGRHVYIMLDCPWTLCREIRQSYFTNKMYNAVRSDRLKSFLRATSDGKKGIQRREDAVLLFSTLR